MQWRVEVALGSVYITTIEFRRKNTLEGTVCTD